MEPRKAYRVLGLPYGAPREDVKNAYRDMAQVWHPDRFGSNERLQARAQKALQRINEAYQTLKDHERPAAPSPQSMLDSTMSAIRDLGDLMDTTVGPTPKMNPEDEKLPNVVLGLDDIEATHIGQIRRHRKKRRRRKAKWMLAILLLVVAAVAAVYILGTMEPVGR